VRQLAELESNVASFSRRNLGEDFLRQIVKLSTRADGPLAAKIALAELGIRLVVEPHLPRTKLDGAAMLSASGHPIVGLTLRYDRIDNFWFTLLHELAHILRHITTDKATFIDDLDVDADVDELEAEADRLASEAMIPRSVWRRSGAFRERTHESVLALASELGIHMAIVAGRLQRETKNFYQFSQLVGHRQVRCQFGLAETESSDEH
jgi:HTH-type transcriptional regulator/antitoxin HigA